MKKGIRYLRFSNKDQSKNSIEWQDINTKPWFEKHEVELVDTFVDAGFSAKTFDRPDMVELVAFIKKHHKNVDYLVINEWDRFSREAGEGLVMAKWLQKDYGVQIVSVSEGITFDYKEGGSFFRTGLQLLLAEDDNIRRGNKIAGGIYTSMKNDRRYVSKLPIGYRYHVEDGCKKPMVKIDEPKADIVRFIFSSFLKGMPYYVISSEAKKIGWSVNGNSAIQRVLTNPLYAGLLKIKAFKEHEGELIEGVHEAIISRTDWQAVKQKLKPTNYKQILNDEYPLRGLLLCHCGRAVTGAASRGKLGRYFDYYKCQVSGHTNINTKKAHLQLMNVLAGLSLSQTAITAIADKAAEVIKLRIADDTVLIKKRKAELGQAQTKLLSTEDKYISNQMNYDTYNRWHTELTGRIATLKADIKQLCFQSNEVLAQMHDHLKRLKDLPALYEAASLVEKRQLIGLLFDNRLYMKQAEYHTTYVANIFDNEALQNGNTHLKIEPGAQLKDSKQHQKLIAVLAGLVVNQSIKPTAEPVEAIAI